MTMHFETVSNSQFTEGIRQFLFQCAVPSLPSIDCVFNGFENETVLPTRSNDFCVFTPLSYQPRGNVIEDWKRYADGLKLAQYMTAEIQVDCFSDSRVRARERAENFVLIASHSVGVEFFSRYGIDCQFAEGLRNLTQVLDSSKFIPRYSFTLRLGFWKKLNVKFEFFDHLNLDGVFNVDVRFPSDKEEK